ncbi:MAG: YdcF family protein [Bacteroidota bacterium]
MSIFFIISKILSFLFNPLFWIGLLLIFAIFLKNKVTARKCLIAVVVLFFLFTNNFLIDMILRGWESKIVPYSELKPSYDVGVVLGGGMVNIDRTNDRLIFRNNPDRFLQALDLYNKKRIKKILISSGAGSMIFRDVIESDLLKRFLLDNHVPDSAIVIDTKSNNTYENAKFTKDLIVQNNFKSVLLITSATHMRRSKGCFEKQSISVDVYPTDKLVSTWRYDPNYLFVPSIDALERWMIFIHEFTGYIVYKTMGYL